MAETLDWAAALLALGARELVPSLVDETLGVLLKYEEDVRTVRGATAEAILARRAPEGRGERGSAGRGARPAAGRR